jgi:nucleobase:cation symporter-1, NCS1 family
VSADLKPHHAREAGDVRAGVPVQTTGIETRSIDWIPDEERHGKVSSVGALWFVGNINLTAMATGVTALAVGASLFWTVVATVLGSLFGTFFMAFHSAQGPQLGLPQLVQSRPQFGYVGAAVTVWVFVLVNYIAYNTSDAILSGSAMHSLVHVDAQAGYLVAAAVAALIALFGYDWIHRVNRWLTWPLIAVMALVTVAALTNGALPAHAFSPGEFRLAPFMTVFVIMGGFQLGWAPYVSDYSRYLPANVGVRSTFWWTYLPSALSGIWVFVLGAVMAAAAPKADPVTAFRDAADSLFPGFGFIAIAALLVGLLSVMAINQYGGSLTMISIRDSIRPVRPTRRIRTVTVLAMGVIVWGVAQFVGVDRFNSFYGNALIFLAYVFTPWTAINLVDFFFVRRGQYVIREIFAPDGIYGRWGWRGNTAYLVGIAAMVPFMVTTPFIGPVAKAWGSVDYSIFVGLPVAGLLYWWLSRGLDLAAERRLVAEEGVLTALHE